MSVNPVFPGRLVLACLAGLSACLAGPPAGAQELVAPAASLRLMVFPARPLDPRAGNPGADAELAAALTGAMLNRCRQGGFEVMEAPAAPDGSSPVPAAADSTGRMLDAARTAEARACLALSWFQEGNRITLIATVHDVWQRRLVAGSTRTGLDDLSLIGTADGLLAELIGQLGSEAPDIAAAWGSTGPAGMSRELVLRCPLEGARISLPGGELLGTIRDGRLSLPFRPLATDRELELKIEKTGYYPKSVKVGIHGASPDLNLPGLYPETSYTLLVAGNPDMVLSSASTAGSSDAAAPWLKVGVGLGFRWFPVADSWFVQGDYMFDWVNNQSDPRNTRLPPFFMHQLSLETAIAVLTPPDWLLRVFAGLGIGCWLSGPQNDSLGRFVDPYLHLPYLDVQLNLHPLVLDVELGAYYVLGSGANLLPSGLVKTLGMTKVSLGLKW